MSRLTENVLYRLPANFRIVNDHNPCIIRDELIENGSGYSIEVEQCIMGYRATIRFEAFADRLFRHVKTKLEDSVNPLRRLFGGNRHLSLRIYRQSVEDFFTSPRCEEDGMWLELEYRSDDPGLSPEFFLDVLVSLVIHLFPYEVEGEREGDALHVMQTRVERSPLNRAMCLALHGYRCKACGTSLKEKYGEIACHFIHVHHLAPLARGNAGPVDPLTDLVPLCPNCHGVAHLATPPYTVEEIAEMLNTTSRKSGNG